MKRIALILAAPLALIALHCWNRQRSRSRASDPHRFDPLLALRGSGRHLWADEHADEFVNRLREGWE